MTGIVAWYTKKSRLPNLISCIYVHNPPARLLERCIKWLIRKGYHFISVEELYDILANHKVVPPGAVCLSIDDGDRENLINVIPVIEKYRIPTCFFIATEAVENGVFWWTYVIRSKSMGLNGVPALEAFKSMPEAERFARIKELQKVMPLEREAMTKEDIFKLAANPLVTIGSHTVNHACMDRCSKDELLREIRESKLLLSQWTKGEIKYFSYPDGSTISDGPEILLDNGYSMAFTTRQELIDISNHHLFYLPRFSINDKGPFVENLCKMTGVWQKIIGRMMSLDINAGFLFRVFSFRRAERPESGDTCCGKP